LQNASIITLSVARPQSSDNSTSVAAINGSQKTITDWNIRTKFTSGPKNWKSGP